MKKILYVIFCLFTWVEAGNVTPDKAKALVSQFVEEGIAFLKKVRNKPKLSSKDIKDFHTLLSKYLDFKYIAQELIGRGNWHRLDKQTRQDYLDAFEDMIVYDYVRRFRDYSDQEVEIKSARPKPSRDGLKIDVYSEVTSKYNKPVSVVWEVRCGDSDNPLITDLVASGISMGITMKREFQVIRRREGGMPGLIRYLRSKAAE